MLVIKQRWKCLTCGLEGDWSIKTQKNKEPNPKDIEALPQKIELHNRWPKACKTPNIVTEEIERHAA